MAFDVKLISGARLSDLQMQEHWQQFTRPMNDHSSMWFLGGPEHWTALTFSGDGWTPSPVIQWPEHSNDLVCMKRGFLALANLSPTSNRCSNVTIISFPKILCKLHSFSFLWCSKRWHGPVRMINLMQFPSFDWSFHFHLQGGFVGFGHNTQSATMRHETFL